MRKLRAGVLLGAASLAAVVALAAAAPAAEPLRVSRPVQATKFDINPGRGYGSPSLAVDPSDPMTVVAAFAELRVNRCGLMRSRDGGQTWTRLEKSPSPSTYPLCLLTNSHTFQGKVAFGRDSTLYYAVGGYDTGDAANRSVFVARSTNLGDTWETAVVADARGRQGADVHGNRPISSLVVDRHSGSQDTVYVAWRRQYPGTSTPNAQPNDPMVAVSTDGGRTFREMDAQSGVFEDANLRAEALKTATTTTVAPEATTTTAAPQPPQGELPPGQTTATTAAPAPTTTTTTIPPDSLAATPDQSANFGGTNPTIAVDRKGTLYVAWVGTYANLTPRPATAHFLSTSTDQGKTFSVTQITPFTRENSNNFGGTEMVWSPEGGADGTLHLVYEGTTRPTIANESDIFYRRSTDGGRTWSDRVVLNDDDPNQLYAQMIPNIRIAPNGRIDVAWFDTRNDPGLSANDVFYTSSSDNGDSWAPNQRITDRLINRKIGPFAGNFDLNAPPGIASTDAFALIAWDDTRFGDSATETQDIFTAAVQYRAVGGGTSKAAKFALAGVVGLLVVGLLLLAASLTSRGRTGRPPEAERVPEQETPTVVCAVRRPCRADRGRVGRRH